MSILFYIDPLLKMYLLCFFLPKSPGLGDLSRRHAAFLPCECHLGAAAGG